MRQSSQIIHISGNFHDFRKYFHFLETFFQKPLDKYQNMVYNDILYHYGIVAAFDAKTLFSNTVSELDWKGKHNG